MKGTSTIEVRTYAQKSDEGRSRPTLMRVAVLVVLIGAMGPYVVGGIRTEQVVAYGGLLLAVGALAGRPAQPRPEVNLTLAVWVVYLLFGVVGSWLPPVNSTRFELGSRLAGLDNLLLPVAVATITIALLETRTISSERVLRDVTLIIPLLMAANTFAAAAQSRGVSFSRWWSPAESASVALNAAGSGRFSGFINQPAEAGLLYGLATLCVIYRLRERPVAMMALTGILVVGGVLTVSKVFLLVGLPLAIWQLLFTLGQRGIRIFAGALGIIGVYALAGGGWLPDWAGAHQLRQVLPDGGQSLVSSATANRFGEESSLALIIHEVWNSSPVFGFGVGGFRWPYDNGWVEAFVVAGLVGAACYSLIFAIFMRQIFRAKRSLERTLFALTLILGVGASMGIPALTANRATTMVWVTLVTLSVHLARESEPKTLGPQFGADPLPLPRFGNGK